MFAAHAWTVVLCGLMTPEQIPAAEKPSLAVLTLEAKQGVSKDTAELLSGALATELRTRPRFGRVMAAKELETLLGFEQQKQLMNCNDTSCLVEIAGQWGVQYLVSGSVGRIGKAFVIHLALIDVRTSRTEASATQTTEGDESTLLGALTPLISQLLGEHPVAAPVPAATAPTAVTPAAPAAASSLEGDEPSPLGRVLMVAGGLSITGAVELLAGVALLGVCVLSLVVLVRTRPELYVGKNLGKPISALVIVCSVASVAATATAVAGTALGVALLAAGGAATAM